MYLTTLDPISRDFDRIVRPVREEAKPRKITVGAASEARELAG